MSNGTQTYPYWDLNNRYLVAAPLRVDAGTKAGFSSKPTVFAQIFEHPTGFFRWFCYGSTPSCPSRLGAPASSLADAQGAAQAHCQNVHYVSPPATT